MQSCETTLQMSREQQSEIRTGRELLTIPQMKERNFSENLGDAFKVFDMNFGASNVLFWFGRGGIVVDDSFPCKDENPEYHSAGQPSA